MDFVKCKIGEVLPDYLDEFLCMVLEFEPGDGNRPAQDGLTDLEVGGGGQGSRSPVSTCRCRHRRDGASRQTQAVRLANSDRVGPLVERHRRGP